MDVFNDVAQNNGGVFEETDLSEILDACYISCASAALPELIEDTCETTDDGVTSDSFKRLISLLRLRDGFSSHHLDVLRAVFKRFDRKGLGKMSTDELFSAVTWLSYSIDYYDMVMQIGREVDVNGARSTTGFLSEYDFIVCLRKVREHDDGNMNQYLNKYGTERTGTINHEELFLLLRHLGYICDPDAVDEALQDAGMEVNQDLTRAELYCFLDTYRKREGLTREEIAEIDAAFERYDRDNSGTINSAEVGKVLRWIGYLTSWDLQQKLVSEVDVDHSGQLCLLEIRKLVRKYREREIGVMKKSFEEHDEDSAGKLDKNDCIKALLKIGCKVDTDNFKLHPDGVPADSDDSDDERINMYEFVHVATTIRKHARANYRTNAGYTAEEVTKLYEDFKKYDTDGSGDICKDELRVLLEDVFPELATSAKLRPHLLKLLKEVDPSAGAAHHACDFPDFLRLMRQFDDLQERDRLMREQQAIESTKFALAEVEEFRELFLGGGQEDEVRTKVTFSDMQRMLEAICPMSNKNVSDLRDMFQQVCASDEEETKMVAHFPEFLMLMRKLLDMNFADIIGRSAMCVPVPVVPPKSPGKDPRKRKSSTASAKSSSRRSSVPAVASWKPRASVMLQSHPNASPLMAVTTNTKRWESAKSKIKSSRLLLRKDSQAPHHSHGSCLMIG